MADVSRGDWQCPNEQCFNHTNFPNAYVYGNNVNCKKCGTGKTAQRAGDWCCPNPQCLNHKNCVYGSKAACPRCGTPKPAGLGGKGVGKGAGMGMMAIAMQPHAAMGMQAGPGRSQPREGDWHCANPECKNHTANVVYGSKTSCPICGEAKPDAPVMAAARAYGNRFPGNQFAGGQSATPMSKFARPGDWNCPNPECKNHVNNAVYGSKDHCPLCDMPKPSTGARIVGQRPGDWHCPNAYCKNHTDNIIFASKDQCPLCSTSRPVNGRARSRSPR